MVQIKDYLIAKTKPKDYWKNMWLTTVPQNVLDDAWRRMPHLFPTAFQQMALKRQLSQGSSSALRVPNRLPGYGISQTVPAGNMRNNNLQLQRNPNNLPLRCNLCNGAGHLARQCPTATMQQPPEVSRCARCGGLGHWARDCPTKPNLVLANQGDNNIARHSNLNGVNKTNSNESGNGRA